MPSGLVECSLRYVWTGRGVPDGLEFRDGLIHGEFLMMTTAFSHLTLHFGSTRCVLALAHHGKPGDTPIKNHLPIISKIPPSSLSLQHPARYYHYLCTTPRRPHQQVARPRRLHTTTADIYLRISHHSRFGIPAVCHAHLQRRSSVKCGNHHSPEVNWTGGLDAHWSETKQQRAIRRWSRQKMGYLRRLRT